MVSTSRRVHTAMWMQHDIGSILTVWLGPSDLMTPWLDRCGISIEDFLV